MFKINNCLEAYMDEYIKGIKPFGGVMAGIQFDKLYFMYEPEYIINL